MIELTKLNGTPFVVNAELIEIIEATPDTVITLINGRKMMVKETVDEVVKKAVDYKKLITNVY
ncbi:MAG TPA: flagellar FlbD family protein [Peptococcaceae bacterium]|jgi:flagellar protein FlbD|nr:flagellar FlbD family protein [Clostridia bacterium]HOB81316.1 flagellar FlbD family protein [Peptococcaceae bacterium]HPZ70591.1 flagellar FlbD family protein [Peptococcaceae bacterium]HQD53402.1 flagellar FlbD family protein [Peptococcaceae bacterium]